MKKEKWKKESLEEKRKNNTDVYSHMVSENGVLFVDWKWSSIPTDQAVTFTATYTSCLDTK